jgi:hypothetical protein
MSVAVERELWVNRVVLTASQPLPVYPDQRTSSDRPGMSGWCHKQTHAPPCGLALCPGGGRPPFSRRHHHAGNLEGAGPTGGSVPEGPA